MKHVPLRTCVCCRGRFCKADLIKVARCGGEYLVDTAAKAEGRGAYVCKNPACLEKAIKKRAFDRSFKCRLPDAVYETLKNITL